MILASDVFGSGANIETLLFGSLLLVDGGDIALAAVAAGGDPGRDAAARPALARAPASTRRPRGRLAGARAASTSPCSA